MSEELKAFHGSRNRKKMYLRLLKDAAWKRVLDYRASNKNPFGGWWDLFPGRENLPTELVSSTLGLPQNVVLLIETIYRGLYSVRDKDLFLINVMRAIPPGATLDDLRNRFFIRYLKKVYCWFSEIQDYDPIVGRFRNFVALVRQWHIYYGRSGDSLEWLQNFKQIYEEREVLSAEVERRTSRSAHHLWEHGMIGCLAQLEDSAVGNHDIIYSLSPGLLDQFGFLNDVGFFNVIGATLLEVLRETDGPKREG